MREELKKGYGANYITLQEREFEDTHKMDKYKHSITGGTWHRHEQSRELRHHKMVEQIDEWVGDIHLVAPASIFWPSEV